MAAHPIRIVRRPCPYCEAGVGTVIQTRTNDQGIKRRLVCLECARRWTTRETIIRQDAA
jgi:transcriptional regulator NrdR family protein